jgi:hypothetical protein
MFKLGLGKVRKENGSVLGIVALGIQAHGVHKRHESKSEGKTFKECSKGRCNISGALARCKGYRRIILVSTKYDKLREERGDLPMEDDLTMTCDMPRGTATDEDDNVMASAARAKTGDVTFILVFVLKVWGEGERV